MDDQKNQEWKQDEKQPEEIQEEEYEFLKETIKKKPLDKKKLAGRAGFLAAGGAIFGLAAAVAFAYAEPAISENMKKNENTAQVQIPEDDEPGAEEDSADQEPGEDVGTEKQEIPAETETAREEDWEITPQDYKKLYTEMVDIAEEPKKAMVTVIGSKNDEDWFQTPYESQISGLIVADTGQELYILTEYRIVEDVDRIQVVFCDGSMVDARFQKADSNTGLSILKVPSSEISSETKQEIIIAPLGNSYGVKQGEPVIAIGSPMGYSESIAFGVVTSTANSVSKIDSEYAILTTDIVGSSDGSGFLVNIDGDIIGVIAQSFAKADTKNLITGLSISQTKELIETLSNNGDIVYMGITGQTITAEVSEKKGIPRGVFVEGVEANSPAMQEGIQNADVIIEVNGEKVETVRGYQQQLKSCQPGSVVKVKAMRQGAEGYVEISFDVTVGAL